MKTFPSSGGEQNVLTSIELMGYDFVADVYYKVTSKGCKETYSIYGGDPAEAPEFEVTAIDLWRDEPYRRAISKTPAFETTGELFNVLADLPQILEAIAQDIAGAEYDDEDEYQRHRDNKLDGV